MSLGLGVMMLTLAGWGCAAAPSKPVTPPLDPAAAASLEATRRALRGSWTLVSLEVVDKNGTHRPVRAAAQLTYDSNSNMTIRGLIDDPATKGAVIVSYEGRIVIDPNRHQFLPADLVRVQSADVSTFAPISPDKVRQYELSDKFLVITYLDASGKPTAVAKYRRP